MCPNLSDASDEDLMVAFQQGNARALDVLKARYTEPLLDDLIGSFGSPAACRRLVETTFRHVAERAASFHAGLRFASWLYSTAYALALPGSVRTRAQQIALTSRTGRPDSRQGDYLKEALSQVPEELRKLVLLHDLDHRSPEDIATLTRLPVSAVESRLHRGRSILQQEIEEIHRGRTRAN